MISDFPLPRTVLALHTLQNQENNQSITFDASCEQQPVEFSSANGTLGLASILNPS